MASRSIFSSRWPSCTTLARGMISNPSKRAAISRRPWVSTTPITTSTPSPRLARPLSSISQVLPTPGAAPRTTFSRPRNSRLAASRSVSGEGRHRVFGHAPGLGDTRHLERGVLRADVRVKPAARGGDQIHRHRHPWVFCLRRHHVGGRLRDQLGAGRPRIEAGRSGSVIASPCGRRAAVEILCRGEALPDQVRPNDDAAPFDQAFVRLAAKDRLRDPRPGEGIDQPGQHGHGQQHDEGRFGLFQHFGSP